MQYLYELSLSRSRQQRRAHFIAIVSVPSRNIHVSPRKMESSNMQKTAGESVTTAKAKTKENQQLKGGAEKIQVEVGYRRSAIGG